MADHIRNCGQDIACSTMEYLQLPGHHESNAMGCMLATGSKTKDYAQVALHVRNGREDRSRGRPSAKRFVPYDSKRVVVHQIAIYAATGKLPSTGEDVSHLCHNPTCFKAEHLFIEPHAVNMDRQRCVGTVTITAPCHHPGCDELHKVTKETCKHSPRCLKQQVFE